MSQNRTRNSRKIINNNPSNFVEKDNNGNIFIKPLKRKKTFDGIDVSATSKKTDKKKTASILGFDGFATNKVSAYRSSYMNSGNSAGAFGDVPLPFVLLNENNGGIFYWPVNLKEKYAWYRFFYKEDPVVGAAIDLHVELPLSKLMLRMPPIKDEKLKKRIQLKYEKVMKKLKLFQKLQSILRDYYIIGNVFYFCEWDENEKEWSKMIQLIPEEVDVTSLPMSDYAVIRYKPELLSRIINRLSIDVSNIKTTDELKDLVEPDEYDAIKNIPFEVLQRLVNDGTIILDTDPYVGDTNEVGSFVHHFARSKQEYEDYGTSILERVLNPLILRELFKNTQVGLATRNMTPKNKISAPDVTPAQLMELREQVDLSYLNPDYAIITNYDWTWEQIGTENRLLDLSKEYENIDEQIYSALGVTKELLTGEGMYSGSKISVEILNTRYLLLREMLQNFIEERLFEPMAEANGFYEIDEFGNKTYLYPKISFSRLTIRDNAEVFDSLFQLYQKGSLPIDVLYDLYNLNTEEINERLKKDMFTPADSQFNELIRNVYNSTSQKLEQTNLIDLILKSLKGPNGEKVVINEEQSEDDDFNFDFDNMNDNNNDNNNDNDESDNNEPANSNEWNENVEEPADTMSVSDFLGLNNEENEENNSSKDKENNE